uniref:Uncharacterized protein n=1 Tax=Apteryx owenii TaxID=8824 RepID=A0A8B9P2E9_APTOW
MGVQTMLLYLSFPVTMFWVSNQAAYFEEHVVQRKVGARTPGPPRAATGTAGTRGHILTPSRCPDAITGATWTCRDVITAS